MRFSALHRSSGLAALGLSLILGVPQPATPAGGGPEAASAAERAPSPPPLPRSARKWVDKTLADLTLEQKAAQMVMVRALGIYQSPRSAIYRELLASVRDLKVGGVVVFDSDLESIPRLLNDLQDAADVPLLVAADFERGLAFRVRRGSVVFPHAMAIGATFSEEAARFVGEVTAREARALGVHWVFAPVADVNNNPANPIVNIRSFGEDPEQVARMTRAFIEGARSEGALTTVKHFPGHGDTAVDSHVALPTIDVDRERLEAVELVPFRRAVEAGVDSVMVGHVAIPAIDPSGAPATLSPPLTAGLLRDEMGFDGLIVTDAIEMAGLEPAWTGGATVRAVVAGADVVLLPADTRVAVQSLVRAVAEGQLTEERLDVSVRRLLETKARLGLHKRRHVDAAALGRQVARPEDVARAAEIAAASITAVRNEGGAYVEKIQAMDLVYEPGSRAKYSDLGLILLGEILERVAGKPLDVFVRERVFEPLGMGDTLFNPGSELLERIAPTENDPWRGRMVRGEVHDENAFALGGVAPHAGLFSTAGDLARFAQMMINGGVFEHRRIVSRDTVDAFTRRAGVADSSRALGWDTKSPERSSAGSLFSPNSFGHTGFTGTSIWIDPERQLFLILLTNRVHPTRENILIRKVRPAVADAVVRALAE